MNKEAPLNFWRYRNKARANYLYGKCSKRT